MRITRLPACHFKGGLTRDSKIATLIGEQKATGRVTGLYVWHDNTFPPASASPYAGAGSILKSAQWSILIRI